MLIVILLVAVLAVAAVVSSITWIRRVASCGRTTDVRPAGPGRSFVGDVMCRAAITSGGLARLEFFDGGVRLRGLAVISRWIVPTWEARYDELAIAELVTLRFSRIAVWLRVRGEPGGIGFLSSFHEEILRELAAREVPVSRAIAQVRSAAELYARGPR